MRILMVEASGRGFLCHYAHALSLGLHQEGHGIRLVTGDRDELAGWRVPFPKSACLRSGRQSWRCLRRMVRRYRPEIVHLQWIDNPFLAIGFVLWARRRGVRVVYTPHNILPHRARWLTMPAYRVLYHHVDRIVARDRHIAWGLEEILDAPRRRMVFLPGSPNLLAHPYLHPHHTGAGPAELPGRGPGEFRLLFFGHGCRRKGLQQLFEAVAAGDWPDSIHLVVAGEEVLDGISPEVLARARRSLRVTILNRYLPPQEVAALFESSDLMLMPYVKLCKSPLTDMAAAFRLPVLRSDRVQGARFSDGLHGFTIPHDDAGALRRALRDIVSRPRQLAAMRQAMEREGDIEQSVRRLAQGHSMLYQDLVLSPPRVRDRDRLTLAEEG
ncbi:MAG TPA: glycosyltransferase [Sedimenticola thiotaurini]|uniref:Glycosyltransferase n=1 Tax=Sedimenticola thiotaurini TaxID=1543721 RepID=A0A831W3X0_9GAMM|nr:glycosyltransferase [Sedimenticola thiotaurini]